MSSPTKREGIEALDTTSNSITRRQLLYVLIIFLACAMGVRYFFKDLRSKSRAASCPNDVWELYQDLRPYAAAHDGLVPPINRPRGNLMMDPDGFYPEHLTNSCWLQCEWSPARRRNDGTHKNDDLGVAGFNDDSFCYLPWAIRTEEEGLAFIEAYKTLDLENRDQELTVSINGEERILPRIRLTEKAIQQGDDDGGEAIPIIVEWPDLNHVGGTVYYAGGYGRIMRIGDGFPMTEAFIAGLREIGSLDGPVPE